MPSLAASWGGRDHIRTGGFEAGVPGQLQSVTHGWGGMVIYMV